MSEERTVFDSARDAYLMSFYKREFSLKIEKEIEEAYKAGWITGRADLSATSVATIVDPLQESGNNG